MKKLLRVIQMKVVIEKLYMNVQQCKVLLFDLLNLFLVLLASALHS